MTFQEGFRGISKKELNNNNFNSEIKNFIGKNSDHILDSDEAKILLKILNNNKTKRINIGKKQLKNLRKVINSNSKNNSFGKDDISKLKNIANKDYTVLETFGDGPTIQAKEAKLIGTEYNNLNGLPELINFSNKDIIDFAALVKAESMGESKKGQLGVAFVILNRMKKRNKTLKQVIYEKGQFSPMIDGNFNRKRKYINFMDKQFIIDIISGKYPNPVGDATFFQTKQAEKRYNNWQRKMARIGKLKTTAIIGNHIFRKEV